MNDTTTPWPKYIFKSVLWFVLPFGMMAGLGVDVTVAARCAVFPLACMSSTLALVAGSLALVAYVAREVGEAAKGDE